MRRLSRLTPQPFKLAMSLALGCTPATRFEAMKSGERLALAVRGLFLEAFTQRSSRMRLMKWVALTRLFAEMAIWFGRALSRTVPMANRNVFTRVAVSGAINSCLLAGISCRVNGICGPRCRRCAAVPSTVLFARCGARMVRNLVNAGLRPSSARWWSCAAWDFGSLRWPTTISTP